MGRRGRGELKRDELESSILDDVEDELILELGLCSGSLALFLLVLNPAKDTCCRVGVSAFSEFPEFSC